MTRASGAKTSVKFAQEVEWKHPFDPEVYPLGQVYGLNIRSCSLGGSKNQFQSETINDKRAVVGLGEGNKAVEGDIVTDFLPEGQEILFRHLLGKDPNGCDRALVDDANDEDNGKWRLRMKGVADTMQGLCVEKAFTSLDRYFIFRGCRINTMTLNLIQEGFHDITWNFIGTSEEIKAEPEFDTVEHPASYCTDNGYTGYQAIIQIKRPARTDETGASQPADTDWVTLGNITNGNITITNNTETDGYVLGSDERASAEHGTRQCTGSWTMFFESVDLYNIFLKGLECKLRFVFNSPEGKIIRMVFPCVKLGGDSPAIESAAGINLNLTFQAKYQSAIDGDPYSDTDVVVEFVKPAGTGDPEDIENEGTKGTISEPTIASAIIDSTDSSKVLLTINAPSGLTLGVADDTALAAAITWTSDAETTVSVVSNLANKTILVTCADAIVANEEVVIASGALKNGGVANSTAIKKLTATA